MSPKPNSDPLSEDVRSAVEFPVRGLRAAAARERSARSQALLDESRRLITAMDALVRQRPGASRAQLYREAVAEYVERHGRSEAEA